MTGFRSFRFLGSEPPFRMMERAWCSRVCVGPGALRVVRGGGLFSQGPQSVSSFVFTDKHYLRCRLKAAGGELKPGILLSPRPGLFGSSGLAVGGFYERRLCGLADSGFLCWSRSCISPFGQRGHFSQLSSCGTLGLSHPGHLGLLLAESCAKAGVWTAWPTATSSGPDTGPGT